jgi:hypothetical protein
MLYLKIQYPDYISLVQEYAEQVLVEMVGVGVVRVATVVTPVVVK